MDEKKTVLGSMKALEVGEQIIFPINMLFSIRSNASNINSQRGKKSLRTATSRNSQTITVYRIA